MKEARTSVRTRAAGFSLRDVFFFLTLSGIASAQPAPGDMIAPYALRLPTGSTYGWKTGRTTVVSFCAYWCDTWKVQVPRLQKAQNSLRGMPVDFLTVSVDGRWTDLAVGTSLSDTGGSWSRELGIDRVPYTLVVDPAGKVRWVRSGIVRTEDLVREVRDAMAPAEAGNVYLTFDDFPSGPMDHELLDLLRKEGVKATFFVITSKAREHLDVLRRAVAEGHRLEVHAWDHAAKDPEPERARKELRSLLGVKASLVRLPGSQRVSRFGGLPLPNPIVNPYDFTRPGPLEIVRRATYSLKPNAIVQLHVGVWDTILALPDLMRNLRQRGYKPSLLSPVPEGAAPVVPSKADE